MCGFKNRSVEFNESESDHVTFGDASKISIKGKDKILIHLKIEDINLSQIFTMCLTRKIIY